MLMQKKVQCTRVFSVYRAPLSAALTRRAKHKGAAAPGIGTREEMIGILPLQRSKQKTMQRNRVAVEK